LTSLDANKSSIVIVVFDMLIHASFVMYFQQPKTMQAKLTTYPDCKINFYYICYTLFSKEAPSVKYDCASLLLTCNSFILLGMYLGIDVGGTKTLVACLTNDGVITETKR